MQKPKTLEIAGVKITVDYVPLTDCCGAYQHNEQSILVDPSYDVEGTLLHELAHAGLGITGLGAALGEQLEEAVVIFIEQVYNPAAKKLLTAKGK